MRGNVNLVGRYKGQILVLVMTSVERCSIIFLRDFWNFAYYFRMRSDVYEYAKEKTVLLRN